MPEINYGDAGVGYGAGQGKGGGGAKRNKLFPYLHAK